MSFKVQAEVVLTGPRNLKTVADSIRKQLQNVTVDVKVGIGKNATKNVNALNKSLTTLQTTSKTVNTNLASVQARLTTMSGTAATASISLLGTIFVCLKLIFDKDMPPNC